MSSPYGGEPEPPPYGDPEPPAGGPGSSYPTYQPYGQRPSADPYANTGYDAAAPHGPTKPVDGVSIAGFVLSLVCCPLVGLVLGVVGLGRTKHDQRSGRWAAIAAVVIGALGTIGGIVFGAFVVWFGTNTVSVDSADVGACVDVDDTTLWDKECTEAHDAEVAYQGDLDADLLGSLDDLGPDGFCLELVREEYAALLENGDYEAGVVVDSIDEDDPEVGEDFVCYVRPTDGSQLNEQLLD